MDFKIKQIMEKFKVLHKNIRGLQTKRSGSKSQDYVTQAGAYQTLKNIFKKSVNIIHPSLFANKSTLDDKIHTYFTEITEIISRNRNKFSKPIIAMWKIDPEQDHWETSVILPKNYQCYDGKQIKNQSEQLFFISCSLNQTKLSLLMNKLKTQGNQIHKRKQILIRGILPEIQLNKQRINHQGKAKNSCGFQSVFNAIIIVLEGGQQFFKQQNTVGSQLISLFPRLTKIQILNFEKNKNKNALNGQCMKSEIINKQITLAVNPGKFCQMIKQSIFVDKSLLIKQFIIETCNCFIITRPRRWGKSLNLDMLKTFLQIQVDQNGQKIINNKINLFVGGQFKGKTYKPLKIAKHKQAMEHFGQWPVIFLSLVGLSQYGQLQNEMKTLISELYETHEYLTYKFKKIIYQSEKLDMQKISAQHKLKKFNRILEKNFQQDDMVECLLFLSQLLNQHFNKKVIILIDEYDLVFNRISKSKYDVDLIQTIYKKATKDNKYVSKAIMTGVLPNSMVEITSGLNHFKKCGVMEEQFAQYFGFTQQQIDKLMNQCFQQQPKIIKSKIKNQYNGYRIGKYTIFNPWSIMHCLGAFSRNQENPLQAYWSYSGNTRCLVQLFKKFDNFSKIEELLNTGFIKEFTIIDSYNQEETAQNNFFFLLLHCGYLTKENRENIFKIPNYQIHRHFYISQIFKIWLQSKFANKKLAESLKITQEDFQNYKLYQQLLNSEVLSILYPGSKNESFFQLLLGGQQQYYAFFYRQQSKYNVLSQVNNGSIKRIDTIFLPIQGKSRTVIIHEYKIHKSKAIEDTLEDAFWQVYANCYVQYALNKINYLPHYQSFKIRALAFYQHSSQKKWMVQIKQYQHNIIQAKLLVQLFQNVIEFDNKEQRDWYFSELKLTNIDQSLNKVNSQYGKEDFKQEIKKLNRKKKQLNQQQQIQKSKKEKRNYHQMQQQKRKEKQNHKLIDSNKNSPQRITRKEHLVQQKRKEEQTKEQNHKLVGINDNQSQIVTRKRYYQMQQRKKQAQQKKEKEQQQGLQSNQYQRQNQNAKITKKRGKSELKGKGKSKSKNKRKAKQQEQELEKQQQKQQMQQIQRSLNEQNDQRQQFLQISPNQQQKQNYREKQYKQPRVEYSAKQKMSRNSERIRKQQKDQYLRHKRRQLLRQNKEFKNG